MRRSISLAAVVPAVAVAVACVPPKATSTQQWTCSPGMIGYTWYEHNGTQLVIDGDNAMYWFAVGHDSSVRLVSTRKC